MHKGELADKLLFESEFCIVAEELEKYPKPVYLTLWGLGGEGIGMFF